MARNGIPTQREAVILSLLVSGERYGREIRELYQRQAGSSLPYGALYVTLDRMEQEGFVEARLGESSHERGGNRRKFFRITADGRLALDSFQIIAASFREGLCHG